METNNNTRMDWFNVIDTVANHLVFEVIPEKSDPSYRDALTKFETTLNQEIAKLHTNIQEIKILSHEPTKDLKIGSPWGDLFNLEVKITGDRFPRLATLKLTNISETLVKEIKEKKEKENHQKEFNDLSDAYLNHTWGASDIESLKTPNVKAVYEAMIKEIDKLYCIGFHLPESRFYQAQIDLLVGKMRILEAKKEDEFEFPKETVLENNATLLKYFLIQYLRTIYKEEFSMMAQWRV